MKVFGKKASPRTNIPRGVNEPTFLAGVASLVDLGGTGLRFKSGVYPNSGAARRSDLKALRDDAKRVRADRSAVRGKLRTRLVKNVETLSSARSNQRERALHADRSTSS